MIGKNIGQKRAEKKLSYICVFIFEHLRVHRFGTNVNMSWIFGIDLKLKTNRRMQIHFGYELETERAGKGRNSWRSERETKTVK